MFRKHFRKQLRQLESFQCLNADCRCYFGVNRTRLTFMIFRSGAAVLYLAEPHLAQILMTFNGCATFRTCNHHALCHAVRGKYSLAFWTLELHDLPPLITWFACHTTHTLGLLEYHSGFLWQLPQSKYF